MIISNEQARWCLENNDKVFILTEQNLVKDSIIHLQDETNNNYMLLVSSFKEIYKNDSIIDINNQKIIRMQENRIESLNKEVKKSNFEKILLKAGIMLELVAILLLSL